MTPLEARKIGRELERDWSQRISPGSLRIGHHGGAYWIQFHTSEDQLVMLWTRRDWEYWRQRQQRE